MGMDIVDDDRAGCLSARPGPPAGPTTPVVAAIEMLAGQIDMAGEAAV